MVMKKSLVFALLLLLKLGTAIVWADTGMLVAPAARPPVASGSPAFVVTAAGNLLDELKQIEGLIDYNETAVPYFDYVEGTIPILISAPHGAKHFRARENRIKSEDAYTAAIAIKLARLTGAHVLYVKNRAPEDPNNDYDTRYKKFLDKIVREHNIVFLMDLHGAKPDRPFAIDVGTFSSDPRKSSCPHFLGTITNALSGLDGVVFNRRFTAHGRGTVTYFANKHLGIEAAQFEINARNRIPSVISGSSNTVSNALEIISTMQALQRVILAVAEKQGEAGMSSSFPAG
jgi:hypothetical protein